jgi:ferrous iron transport protein B
MFDLAQQHGMDVDIPRLSELFGAPVITTVGHKRKGITELKHAILEHAGRRADSPATMISYGEDLEAEILSLQSLLDADEHFRQHARWFAIKLLENDEAVIETIRRRFSGEHELWDKLRRSRETLAHLYGDAPEILIADQRYGFISGLIQQVTTPGVEFRHDLSDHIDAVLTHPVLGLPIFLAMMYVVFYLTFALGQPVMNLLEHGFNLAATVISGFWPAGSDSLLRSLIVDGIIHGVGGVLVFLPNIVLLFFAIAILEHTGYMARAAFIMDRFMHKIGLHGKSFIPMLIGFGCSVPAIMATRILENKRDRLTTIMIIPLISCGARYPIYMLLIPAFFAPRLCAPILWLIYLIGIALAIIAARLLRQTLFKGDSYGMVIELPPYRMPTLRGLLIHTWQRGWMYLRKAGTIILPVSIILWAMTSFPRPSTDTLAGVTDPGQRLAIGISHSVTGKIGKGIEPVIKPLGFDWKIGTALIGALAAKEVFVAQMGIVYSLGDVDEQSGALQEILRHTYSRLTAFCIMLFCLISSPCMATFAIARKETGTWRWPIVQFLGLTVLAYTLTLITYQVGSLVISMS